MSDKLYNIVDFGIPVNEEFTTVCYNNYTGFKRLIDLYARPGNVIVDPTFGKGTFWKLVDRNKYTVLATDIQDGIDLCALPYEDNGADVVVLDPPYRYAPKTYKPHEKTKGHGKVDELYNLKKSGLHNMDAVLQLYHSGIKEAYRILKIGGFLWVKCQDMIQSNKQWWAHIDIMNMGKELGFVCRDLMIVVTKSPTKSRWKKQRHLRKAHSYFIVFRKGGAFPFGVSSMDAFE